MICTVKIERMEFRAGHGCYDLEKKVGGIFTVDIEYDIEAGEAVAGDDVSKTVSYVDVYETVRGQMAVPSNIIEHAAARIIGAVKARFPQILRIEATVAKIAPPLGGKAGNVSVTLSE